MPPPLQDWHATPGWKFEIEYEHVDLGAVSPSGPFLNTATTTNHQDNEFDLFRLTALYKFGADLKHPTE